MLKISVVVILKETILLLYSNVIIDDIIGSYDKNLQQIRSGCGCLFEATMDGAALVISPVQLQLLWLPRHFREALLWDCRLVVLLALVSLFCRFFLHCSSLKTISLFSPCVCSTLPL